MVFKPVALSFLPLFMCMKALEKAVFMENIENYIINKYRG